MIDSGGNKGVLTLLKMAIYLGANLTETRQLFLTIIKVYWRVTSH